jgi:hypothetical protein
MIMGQKRAKGVDHGGQDMIGAVGVVPNGRRR